MADWSDLEPDTRARFDRLRAGLIALAQSHAGRIETDMKANRAWQDRTGNARNRLFARPYHIPTGPNRDEFGIVAGHGMQYGVHLELGTRFMRIPPMAVPPGSPSVVPATGLVGYPIIVPTLDRHAPRFFQDARRLLNRR
jgi:hypothetical protein